MARRRIIKGVIKKLQEIIDDTSLQTTSKKTPPPAKQKQGRPKQFTAKEKNEARRAGYRSTGNYFEDKKAGTLKSKKVSPTTTKRRKTIAANKATLAQHKSTVKTSLQVIFT